MLVIDKQIDESLAHNTLDVTDTDGGNVHNPFALRRSVPLLGFPELKEKSVCHER